MKIPILKVASLFICASLILSVMCACNSADGVKSTDGYSEPDGNTLSSGEYFSDKKYSLSWDDEKKCVLLYDKAGDTYWSSIPYSFYTQEDPSGIGMVRMHSPIFIEYVTDDEIKTAYALVEAVNNGYVTAEKCKDGVRVTYYMSNLEISIPIEYTVCDNGLRVTVAVSDICENENLLYSVSVSPFMCSAKNNSDNSYLFVPSGSGTLMYVDDGGRNSRTYHDLVYGADYATTVEEKTVNKENITMPVFGAKQGDNAICGIITDGAEIAQINAEAGNEEFGYSAVWATFLLRGINSLYVNDYQGYQSQISIVTDDIVDLDSVSVEYIPLSGNDADYVGMAKVYRNYLQEKYSVSENKDFSPIYLKMLGGTLVSENVFGLTHDKLTISTSYEDAEKIIEEIKKNTGVTPIVQMSGYGKSGLDIRKIAGGMALSGKFGDYDDFAKFCDSEKISCYFDFDILHYEKSGGGVSRFADASITVNNAIAKQYYFSPANYKRTDKNDFCYILKREKISKIADKLIKYLNKNEIPAVSLSSLSSVSFSAYPDRSSYNKNGFAALADEIYEDLRSNGKRIMASYAFDYAAVAADCIVESPVKSSQNDGFDKDIPFYQIAMKGITPTAVSAVNLAINPKTQFLKAVETGSSLCFALCNNWNEDYMNSKQSVFQFALYDTWKTELNEMVSKSAELLKNVSGSTVTAHTEILRDVYETRFSNGTRVYVNYSAQKANTPVGSVDALGFKYVLAGG